MTCCQNSEALKKGLAECAPAQCKTTKMGIGPIGDPSVIFARKFRWTLEADNLPPHFMKWVKFDYAERTIEFAYYDVFFEDQGVHALSWASKISGDKLPKETMTFTTYDGCGHALYTAKFQGLNIVKHHSDFDYSSSEASEQIISVGYHQAEFEVHEQKPAEPVSVIKPHWTFRVYNYNDQLVFDETTVKVSNRPTLDIEEIDVHHLNAKAKVPGKAEWETLTLSIEGHIDDLLLNQIVHPHARYKVVLSLWESKKKVESWTLDGAWFQHVDSNLNSQAFNVRFAQASYEEGKGV